MDLEQLTIGKMAALNHVSEQTLRLYDKMGLFTPQIVNPDNGYRYYSIGQSAQLDLIGYYQNIGFSLRDIQNKLMTPDADTINQLLVQQSEELERQIAHLEQCKQSIHATLENYHHYQSLPKDGTSFLEYLPARRILVYDSEENMFDTDYAHYEYNLRRFKNHLSDLNYDIPMFGNVGTIIRSPYLSEEQLVSHELFMQITDIEKDLPNIETIPEGTYLSLCCSDFDKEEGFAHQLLYEAKQMGRQIEGDYFCEVLSEYPKLSTKKREFYYKMRVKLTDDTPTYK